MDRGIMELASKIRQEVDVKSGLLMRKSCWITDSIQTKPHWKEFSNKIRLRRCTVVENDLTSISAITWISDLISWAAKNNRELSI